MRFFVEIRDNPPKRRRTMPRILTPSTHSQETLAIAHELLPTSWELASAPHGRPEFFDLLKDTEYYIGAGRGGADLQQWRGQCDGGGRACDAADAGSQPPVDMAARWCRVRALARQR